MILSHALIYISCIGINIRRLQVYRGRKYSKYKGDVNQVLSIMKSLVLNRHVVRFMRVIVLSNLLVGVQVIYDDVNKYELLHFETVYFSYDPFRLIVMCLNYKVAVNLDYNQVELFIYGLSITEANCLSSGSMRTHRRKGD